MKHKTNYLLRVLCAHLILFGASTLLFTELISLIQGNLNSIVYVVIALVFDLFAIYHINKLRKNEVAARYEILYNSDGTFCAKEKESGMYLLDNYELSAIAFYYDTLEKAHNACDVHNYTFPIKPAVTDSKNYQPK